MYEALIITAETKEDMIRKFREHTDHDEFKILSDGKILNCLCQWVYSWRYFKGLYRVYWRVQ